MKPLLDLLQPILDWLKQFPGRSVETAKKTGEKLKPPKLYSWQSALILSVVLGLFSLIAIGIFGIFAALFGQAFLLVAVFLLCTEAAFIGTPWLIAALISAFLYLNLRHYDISNEIANLAIVAFPIIAATLALLPMFIDKENNDRAAKWKNALLVYGVHILVACWIQLYFVMQGWLEEYPSLMAENFNRNSPAVVKINFQREPVPSKGTALLDKIGEELSRQLNDQPWDTIKPLTPDKLSARINTIKQAVGAEVASPAENALWRVQKDIIPESSGYIVYLEALWEGPKNQLQKIDSAKLCKVYQGFSKVNQFRESVGIVECQPARKVKPIIGEGD
ncbi:MAG: DUF5357 family protein [Cyanobacteriota bacterium]|nr:DUF5357 family protein [Cyanobacteriota bacterium]